MLNNAQNDDIDYIFATHRKPMEIVGLWPLCKTKSIIAQWSLITIIQLSSFGFMFMEFNGNYEAETSIEGIMYFTSTVATVMKNFCITLNRTKLTKNMNAAINDWMMAKNDEESYQIMKKHAFKSRLCTTVMMYTLYLCVTINTMTVVLISLSQAFSQDTDISNADSINTTKWIFIIPSGDLGDKINGPLYAVFIVLQFFQLQALGVIQCISDCFYITIVLHLAGQLEVLQVKFRTFANKPDTEANYRKRFTGLINRHCELMDLVQNLEDTFNMIILYQLVIVTLLFALLGLNILFYIKNSSYILLSKYILSLTFFFGEALIYTYGGDFIQRESEDIFYAMFMTSWFTLPSTLTKDLYFAMMRTRYPLRLTGGKFFFANRETMLNVLKTSASYISVLRVALKD